MLWPSVAAPTPASPLPLATPMATPARMPMMASMVRVLELLLRARQVAARDVAGLVRDDADQLVGRLGLGQQSGVDEDLHAAGDEGVDALVVDDVDLHRGGIEAGSGEDRIGIGAQGRLDLRIADQAGGRATAPGPRQTGARASRSPPRQAGGASAPIWSGPHRCRAARLITSLVLPMLAAGSVQPADHLTAAEFLNVHSPSYRPRPVRQASHWPLGPPSESPPLLGAGGRGPDAAVARTGSWSAAGWRAARGRPGALPPPAAGAAPNMPASSIPWTIFMAALWRTSRARRWWAARS